MMSTAYIVKVCISLMPSSNFEQVLSTKLLNPETRFLRFLAIGDAVRRFYNILHKGINLCKQLNSVISDKIKKIQFYANRKNNNFYSIIMMPQNNGGKNIQLPNRMDSLQLSEEPSSCEPILEILERFTNSQMELLDRFTKSQMEFVLAMTRLSQQSFHDSSSVRSWLMPKAKQYDNRLQPLNSRLELRSNDELLEFIVTCAIAETNSKHSC
ncbi:hypothetical protein [Nostoc sp. FACHB-190]|uniref:hypothetical protein n=1 Tax=Nostoc sp. FACHB-190 TaxID=2692838 RepID=UPI001684CABC|nr:hypothetical protein [Nostoc sp. FACHB-190]MBD2301545.1 hypothetical protein [Nostoc sp. FACHB-190]